MEKVTREFFDRDGNGGWQTLILRRCADFESLLSLLNVLLLLGT